MSIVRLLGGVVVIGLVGGAIAWHEGLLKFGPGGVSVDTTQAEVDIYTKASTEFSALRYQDAYDSYSAALKQRPKDPLAADATYLMAKCMEELKKGPEAIAAYKKFVEQFPNDERVAKAKERIEKLAAML